jgi:hypothetical protein
MNRTALDLPKSRLLEEFTRRREAKQAEQAELDARYGRDRLRMTSYMENLGWPGLFGYEMQPYLEDADFTIEQHLRQQIFWADNVDDDTLPGTEISPTLGMYWDMTLFGQEVRHTAIGVPEFLPHPFRRALDLETLGHFDFHETGVMPRTLAKYQRMGEILRDEYGDALSLTFPCFHRGPLDVYVQLRGYEQFLEDAADRPAQLREGLLFLADERLRFARERQRFLGEAALPRATFVADDWVNLPFLSPALFRDFVAPAYRRIRENEGPVAGFHTCGNLLALVEDLVAVFPELASLDVSGWNDLRAVDARVPASLSLSAAFIPTVVLGDVPAEQRQRLEAIAEVGRRRHVSAVTGGLTNMYPTYEEMLARLGRFLAQAREIFRSGPPNQE